MSIVTTTPMLHISLIVNKAAVDLLNLQATIKDKCVSITKIEGNDKWLVNVSHSFEFDLKQFNVEKVKEIIVKRYFNNKMMQNYVIKNNIPIVYEQDNIHKFIKTFNEAAMQITLQFKAALPP